MASAALPLSRRDPGARARLQEVARGIAPAVLARERLLPVPGPLGDLLGGGVQRGGVVTLDGPPGAGRTSAALQLAAAATAAGEWAAAVDPAGTFGGAAADEAGVVLERFAVVRGVPAPRWATVVGALLDGVALVVAELHGGLSAGDARRLTARARERGAVLVALGTGWASWPVEAGMHLRVGRGAWPGFGPGSAQLGSRSTEVHVDGRGTRREGSLATDVPPRERSSEVTHLAAAR